MMRVLRWLIVGLGLSLLALSLALHYRIGARFDFGAPPAAPPIASDGMIRIEKFGQKQTFIIRVFDNRTDAERLCGKDNIMQWEELPPTHSRADAFSCRSDLP
jgi:hypothetical protein